MKEKISSLFKYFFETNPGSEMRFYIPLIVITAILILGSLVFYFIYKNRKKEDFAFKRIFKSTSKNLITLGLILLILLMIRFENIMYLSMRAWLYLTLLFIVLFLYALAKKFFLVYPKERENTKKPISKNDESKKSYSTKKRK